MPGLKPRYILSISLTLLFFLLPASAQADEWWYGDFVNQHDAERLIKEGHARPFNCMDAKHGPKTYDAIGSRTDGHECKTLKVVKIPDYEVIILHKLCESFPDEGETQRGAPFKSMEMLLRLEQTGRILAYHRGRIGRHHLPYTNEMSACEWRD